MGSAGLQGVLFASGDGSLLTLRGYQRLAPLAILLGPNGAGKSSLLRAIDEATPIVGVRGGTLDSLDRWRGRRAANAECEYLVDLAPETLDAILERSKMSALHDDYLDDEDVDELPLWASWTGREARVALGRENGALEGVSEALVRELLGSSWVRARRNASVWCAPPVRKLPPALHDEAFAILEADRDRYGLRASEQALAELPVPLLGVDRTVVPVVVKAPVGAAHLTEHLLAVVGEAIQTAARFRFRVSPARARPDSWTRRVEGDAVAPREELVAACAQLSHLASQLLPGFIGDSEIVIAPRPVDEWRDGWPKLEIRLKSAAAPHGVPYQEGPGGFVLWIELAVLEAVGLLDRLVVSSQLHLPKGESAPLGVNALLTEELADLEALDPLLQRTGALPNLRIYLLDEPERSLHPALQREAASALTDLAGRGAYAVIATHSPHFLRLTDHAAFSYVRSEPASDAPGRRWLSAPILPEHLDGWDPLMAEMGFDRGELLCGVRRLAFVEGESDVALLSEAARSTLHREGILLVPLRGAQGAASKGVVDSYLVEVGSWDLAVVFDSLTAEEVSELADDAAARRRAMNDKEHLERREIAKVLERGVSMERPVVPIGVGAADIFDLVDETLVDDFAARYGDGPLERFPGHDAAREAARAQGVKWKAFYRDTYGLDIMDPGLFRELGRLTAEQGRYTPGLTVLIDRLCAGQLSPR